MRKTQACRKTAKAPLVEGLGRNGSGHTARGHQGSRAATHRHETVAKQAGKRLAGHRDKVGWPGEGRKRQREQTQYQHQCTYSILTHWGNPSNPIPSTTRHRTHHFTFRETGDLRGGLDSRNKRRREEPKSLSVQGVGWGEREGQKREVQQRAVRKRRWRRNWHDRDDQGKIHVNSCTCIRKS